MERVTVKNMVLGFVAAAIAVLTVHELINFILLKAGLFPRVPWSMEPAAVTGIPQIISDMFWGGVWGVLFVLIYPFIPGGSATIKGLVFGIVAPAILGVLILLPLITGRSPLFFDFDLQLIVSVLLILGGFGAAMGWLYGFLAKRT